MLIRTIGQAVENRPLFSVAPGASVYDACLLLDRENIGALAVLDGAALVGLVSERDVIRRAVRPRLPLDDTPVARIMTPDPQTAPRATSLVIAMDLMMRGGFRHLPVVDDGICHGMISLRDIPAHYRTLYDRYEAAFTELEERAALGLT